MKKFLATIATAAAILPAAMPAFAADIGVSIGISQPGVYGRVDIGRFPQPEVVVQQPVIIQRPYGVAPPPPVYLWVPPAHRQNWRRYCGQYNACGAPVYFVRDQWYGQHVRPHQDERFEHRDERRDDRHDRRDDRHDDRRDDRRDDRGPGHH